VNTILLLSSLGCLQAASDEAGRAIQALRSQQSYRTRFKATIEAPGSDSLKIEGESVWVKPGVLYIHYTGSGGDEKRIVRVGDRVWIYHEFLEDWVTGQEMGSPGAGRGVQNPDEVLAILAKHAGKANDVGGNFVLDFAGADIEKIMKEQASQGDFDWKGSKVAATLELAKGLLTRFTSTAELVSLDEKLKGKTIKYSAEVDVVNTNQDKVLRFTVIDEKTKQPVEVPVPDHILQEIEGYLAKKP